jgi:hypothetical protein
MPIDGVNAFPLSWPIDWPRTTNRRESPYEVVEFGRNRDLVLASLLKMTDRRDIVLSTNVPLRGDGLPYATGQAPKDPGVAVYWMRGGKPQVIACDRWYKVGENARAIWYALESLRQLERCGASQVIERAYAGFAALPAANRTKPWREVLGFPEGPVWGDAVEARYRELSKLHHPDVGGDTIRMAEINVAYKEALVDPAVRRS